MALQVGELFATLGLQDKEFHKALGGAKSALGGLGSLVGGAVAGAFTALGGAMATGVGLASVYIIDAQESLKKLQASLGLTEQETEKLGNVAEDVFAKAYGESIGEVTDSVRQVQSALQTMNEESIQAVTEGAYVFRDLYGYEINETAWAVKNLTSNFEGLSETDALDILAKGFQEGADYSGELLDTVKEYAPQFSAMGLSAEQMMGILVAGAQNGAWNLDKVGDAMKELTIRTKDGSDTTSEAFKALGLDAQDMASKFAQGGEEGQKAFMATMTALSAMEDPLKRNQAGVALFGTMWEDLEANTVLALQAGMDGLGEYEGAMDSMANTARDTLGNKWTQIWRTFISSFTDEGGAVYDFLNGLSDTVLANLPAMQGTIDSVMNGIKSAFDMSGAMGMLQTAWNAIQSVFGTIGAFITEHKDTIVNIFTGLWGMVQSIWSGLWSGIQAIVEEILPPILEFIMMVFGEIVTWWQENGARIMDAVSKVFNFILIIVQAILPIVLAIVTSVWENIKGVINGAVNVIVGIIEFFSALFTGNWSGMWEAVKSIVGGAVEFIWNLIQLMFIKNIWSGIKGLFTSLKPEISAAWEFIKGIFTGATTNITSTIAGWGSNMWGFIKGIMTNIQGTISGVWNAIMNGIRSILGGLLDVVKTPFDKVRSWLSGFSLEDIGRNIINGLINGMGSMAGAVVDKVKSIAKSISDGIKGFFGIHSPSKLTEGYGINIGQGLNLGLDSMRKTVARTAERIAEATDGGLQGMMSGQMNALTIPDVGVTSNGMAVARANRIATTPTQTTKDQQQQGMGNQTINLEATLVLGGREYKTFVKDISTEQEHQKKRGERFK